MNETGSWLLLVDFDGTMTRRDADFAIADAVLGPDGKKVWGPIAEAYEGLRIDVREYFRRLLRAMNIPPEAFARHARNVPLRPGFAELVRWADQEGISLKIVSEGLDVYVHPILDAAGFGDLAVSCNRAVFEDGCWRVTPPPDGESCPRCLNCKGAHVRRAHEAGLRVVLIGNGTSDLCGARLADVVLARDVLLDHCRRENIPCRSWTGFDDVIDALVVSLPNAGKHPQGGAS